MGIGYQGKTLQEMIQARDRVFEETGCLWGLKELTLHEQDPAEMMRFQLRALGACVTSRELAKLTAASPIVRTIGECIFMLLVPEGDVAAASFGLTGHVGAAPLQVKHMINLGYEQNPGIRPGDIFSNNDPRYGGPHAADNYTFMPIFYNDELVAWSCAMNHITDVGAALAPGSYPGLTPTCFTDGFLYPLLKTGENFTTHKWFELMWERRTRQPLFNIIDNKMRVTGAKLLHDKILEIIGEFGLAYFQKATREILERERQRALGFFRERTIPGTYQELNLGFHNIYEGRMTQLFPQSDRSWLITRRTDINVGADGSVTIDLEGSNTEGPFGYNVSEGALRVGLSFWWVPMVMYGGVLNTAINYALNIKVPPGTIFSPVEPYHSTTSCFHTVTLLLSNLTRFQCRAMWSRGIAEEALLKEQSSALLEQEGVFDNGVPWGFTYFSLAGADSTGARAYKDGEPLCASHLNPESDAGEDEEYELYMPPFMLLGKTFLPGSCGYGKYRGSPAIQVVMMVVDPGKMVRQSAACGSSAYTTQGGVGLSGGYPGVIGWNMAFHDTNMRQLIDAGEGYPSGLEEIQSWIKEGKLEVGRVEVWGGDMAPSYYKDGDLHVFITGSSGGWGDPLDRSPDLIERDLNEGWTGPEANSIIYGAVAQRVNGKWKLDREATLKAQEQIRRQRKSRVVTAKDWWSKERERVISRDFSIHVNNLYDDVLKYDKFRREFDTTWQLPVGDQA